MANSIVWTYKITKIIKYIFLAESPIRKMKLFIHFVLLKLCCITDYGWKNSNLKLVKLEKNIYFNKVSLIRLHRIPNSSGHSRKYCVNKITILTNLRRQNTCPVVLYLVSLTSEKSHLGHLLKDILYFV